MKIPVQHMANKRDNFPASYDSVTHYHNGSFLASVLSHIILDLN